MTPLLEVRDLSRRFDVRVPGGALGGLLPRRVPLRAVDGVSFSVAPGRTLGLVGESGCGKSTTARLVLGLMPPSGGRVLYEGAPVTARHDAAWRQARRRMQMVYQDPLGALDRRLPVVEQIGEPFAIHAPEIARRARRERALGLMDQVGLSPDMAGRYPHELSGGQRQRVVIARAIALDPRLLVCDEPVSALDVSIQAQVLNLLEDIRAERGMASLFISHDLKVVRQVADAVAVMYLGRIVESGTPDEVFHAPAHPYTRALVSAIPTPRRRARERIVLQGDPPSPADVPRGCAFHPRCPVAVAMCRAARPALADAGGGRRVACHLVTGPAAATA